MKTVIKTTVYITEKFLRDNKLFYKMYKTCSSFPSGRTSYWVHNQFSQRLCIETTTQNFVEIPYLLSATGHEEIRREHKHKHTYTHTHTRTV